MRVDNKELSIKTMLITIICTIMILNFIGTTYLFIKEIPNFVQYEILGFEVTEGTEYSRDMGNAFKSRLNVLKESEQSYKEKFGEDYPIEELLIMMIISQFSSKNIVKIYMSSLASGVILGIIIYVVIIQNCKGKKLLKELIIALSIVMFITYAIGCGYNIVLNKIINEDNMKVYAFSYDFESFVMQYCAICICISFIIYCSNQFVQSIRVYKLNKELEKIERE